MNLVPAWFLQSKSIPVDFLYVEKFSDFDVIVVAVGQEVERINGLSIREGVQAV